MMAFDTHPLHTQIHPDIIKVDERTTQKYDVKAF